MSYTEIHSPPLHSFLLLSQPSPSLSLNLQFLPCLFSASSLPASPQVIYLVFIAKQGFISLITLEQSCLISKLNIEIMHSYLYKITALKLQAVGGEKQDQELRKTQYQNNSQLSKGVYLLLGFEDGSVHMYMIVEQNKGSPLVKIFNVLPEKLSKKKQVIVNMQICQNSILIASAYSLFIYRKVFQKEEPKTSIIKSKSEQKIKQETISEQEFNIQINQSKINFCSVPHSSQIYIFNELQGAVIFDIDQNTIQSTIQGSIKILQVLRHQGKQKKEQHIVVVGGTENCIKFINFTTGIVQNYTGLKNYPSCFCVDQNQRLWVGCLDGTICCFIRKQKQQQANDSFVLVESKLKYHNKISNLGIKQMMVIGKLMIVVDCQFNINLFDVGPEESESCVYQN